MNTRLGFFKTTAIGGLVFLVPLVVVTAILGKALQLGRTAVVTLEKVLPIDSAGDLVLLNLLAIFILGVACFLAGLVAHSGAGRRFGQRLEQTLLAALPGYAFVKGMTDGLRESEEQSRNFVPVMASFDDNAQLAFEVERSEDGAVVVYLPGCPDPWSGSVVTMTEDRVTPVQMTVSEAVRAIRTLGSGTSALGRPSAAG
jgi:uncharacterized membrane protein